MLEVLKKYLRYWPVFVQFKKNNQFHRGRTRCSGCGGHMSVCVNLLPNVNVSIRSVLWSSCRRHCLCVLWFILTLKQPSVVLTPSLWPSVRRGINQATTPVLRSRWSHVTLFWRNWCQWLCLIDRVKEKYEAIKKNNFCVFFFFVIRTNY